jgi:uncharacterized repeat protein (TIGR03803 family)
MRVRVLCFLLLPFSVQAQHNFRVLHAFGSGNDGAGVYGSVILDAQGNVYGTTAGGGAYGDFGTVFRLTPENNGRWKETLLHSFHSQDGGAGAQGGLVLGHDSTLYGTTQSFGEYNAGTTFQLTPQEGGWTFRVIHQFGGPGDYACCPWGSLIVDPKGNLYGTSYAAFELSPGAGKWTETQLHDFNGKNGDGLGPLAGPIRDIAGNLYGTTNLGGGGDCGGGCGIAWELSPPAGSQDAGQQGWTEHILHAFGVTGGDGAFPNLGQLAIDAQGNLYGTTGSGGPLRAGTVFELAPPPSGISGEWKETILHGFGEDQNGYLPEGGVIFDNSGNLYGTTGTGGAGCGVVFKLSLQNNDTWKYTLLHTFHQSDGCAPDANLTFGPDGKLYGTTSIGGAYGGGVVFQLTP